MAFKVDELCIGCGACEFACNRGAISQGDEYPVFYKVDPLLCDDCEDCVRVCPVDCLVPDPEYAVCYGRGCPLSSKRYEGWICSIGTSRCEKCGSMMWRNPDGIWLCNLCTGLKENRRSAKCPKIGKIRTQDPAHSPSPTSAT